MPTLSIEDDGLGVSEEALETMLNLKPPPEGSLISRFGEGAKLAGVLLQSLEPCLQACRRTHGLRLHVAAVLQ